MEGRPWVAALLIALAIILVIGVLAGVGAIDWNGSYASRSLVVIVGFVAVVGIVTLVAIGYYLANLSNREEALGLPAGSVRALIALLIIVMFAVMAFYFSEALQGAGKEAPPQTTTEATGTQPPTDTQPTTDTTTSTGTVVVTDTTTTTVPAKTGTQKLATDEEKNEPSTGNDVAKINGVNDLAKLVLQTLGALMTTIIGFYFGSKSAAETADKTTKTVTEAVTRALRS